MVRHGEGDRDVPVPGDVVLKSRARSALTPSELVTINLLATRGMPVQDIAEMVERSPGMVRKALTVSKEMVNALAPAAVEYWGRSFPAAAARGDHRPMRDLLIATKTIEGMPGMHGIHVNVQTNIALPGLPTPIDVTPKE